MKIILIGYGKMGQAIEKIATSIGHEIIKKIDIDNQELLKTDLLKQADVAIEFTQPSSVLTNIDCCLQAGLPIVVGTTGWYDEMSYVRQKCIDANGGVLWASNFSIGVQLFFAVNRFLAQRMNTQVQYEVELSETHHTQKLDAPSGTAISLAEDIVNRLDRKTRWAAEPATDPYTLSIASYRINEVPGTHEVIYTSEADKITIRHEAFNRQGFAAGAITAAEWMAGRKGFYSMQDMLSQGTW